jgi:hypothetical protein
MTAGDQRVTATGVADATGQGGALAALGEPAGFRMVMICFLAAGIGLAAGAIAFLLYKLIGFFTNFFFFHRLATDFTSARLNTL